MDSDDLWLKGVTAIVIIGVIMILVAVYKSDQREKGEIAASCESYLKASRTLHDTLESRIACDQLWSAKGQREAIAAAAIAASAAAGAAASAASRR